MIKAVMIAPCGMNCAVCLSQFRNPPSCPGCNTYSKTKPKYCSSCVMVNCKKRLKSKDKFCLKCDTYPCKRLKDLDKRYRTKYGMSMLENLRHIREKGIRSFIKSEKLRWACPKCGKLLCVHRPKCVYCGTKRKVCN